MCVFCSQKGVPELVLKDQKDIALEITVTNSPSDPRDPAKDGDDAHEAKLVATFPDTLTYSAYRELRAFPVSGFTAAGSKQASPGDGGDSGFWRGASNRRVICFSVTGEAAELCCQSKWLTSGL